MRHQNFTALRDVIQQQHRPKVRIVFFGPPGIRVLCKMACRRVAAITDTLQRHDQ